ncbi:DinB family protein [Nesterenkonia ebinurensis]|uniref:DinB family protein n=1 Tax=Nesterenkonia ebinurensis TaxID=2608252 RepID=UPI00123CD39F|nr:DinB family protein [Nesterenkonia ebinurensis]
MRVNVYVESGVAMAYDSGTAAWVFDVEFWGLCGQGLTETEALAELSMALPREAELSVVERIQGDEGAFDRDTEPATEAEVERTLEILTQARAELLHLLQKSTEADLGRPIPQDAHFAGWSTICERAWHIADTESRYYLPSLGLPSKPRAQTLVAELSESAEHVQKTLRTMLPNMSRSNGGELWTSTKLLRRLAWHEPGELAAIRQGA